MFEDLNKLPNGVSDFAKLRKEQRIYVDKTDLIYKLTQNSCQPILFTRPRRFGKSLLVSTLKCLFTNQLELFKGLKIEPLWQDTEQYYVLHLDFSSMNSTSVDAFKISFNNALDRFILKHKLVINRNAGDSVSEKLIGICNAVGENKLVILIDEYDAPLTTFMNSKEQFERVSAILCSFYQVVKSRYKAVRFMFMTGITRCKFSTIFSGFNTVLDESLNPSLGALLGFTQTEIETYFKEFLEKAASALNISLDAVSEKLKEHYAGFCFEMNASVQVYNPWSVLNFLPDDANDFRCLNYWCSTANCSKLITNYLEDFNNKPKSSSLSIELLDKLKQLDEGEVVDVLDFDNAVNPKDLDPVVLLYQAGYLTIKKTVGRQGFRLGIPNVELQSYLYQEFYYSIIKPSLTKDSPFLKINGALLEQALIDHDSKSILESIDFMVKGIPTDTKIFNNEKSLREIIFREVLILGANVDRDGLSDSCRADIIVKSDINYYVFELKLYREGDNLDALLDKAVSQVESRNYGIDSFKKNLYRYVVIISKEQKQVIKNFELPEIKL